MTLELTPSTTAVCTICSKNYLHFARTLMDSLRTVHPDWDQYVLLVDEIQNAFDPAQERFQVIEVSDLPLPEKRSFLFRYQLVELNTAVKPWFLELLLRTRGYGRVVYLDPDIFVFRPMTEIENALGAGNLVVLTPHLTRPLDEGMPRPGIDFVRDELPTEHAIFMVGCYNLGFIALARHERLWSFLDWWQKKVTFHCLEDSSMGMYLDQKWIDHVPALFGDALILRHDGYNVAFWNLRQRHIERRGNELYVNSQPLVFFHFSSLDPTLPDRFSHGPYLLLTKDLPEPTRGLIRSYCEAVLGNGFETCHKWEYAFARFHDGTKIPDGLRRFYLTYVGNHGSDLDPFGRGRGFSNALNAAWGSAVAPLVTVLMRAIWERRPELQRAFPDIDGSSRYDFARWFVAHGAAEECVPGDYVDTVRESLAATKRPSWSGALRRKIQGLLKIKACRRAEGRPKSYRDYT